MFVDQIPSLTLANGIGILVGIVGALLFCHYLSLPLLTAHYQNYLPAPKSFAGAGELDADAEWVVTLLEENRGQMYQQEILRASNWSESKVSALLSEMEFDGHITRIHVGRENIVFLADHEPTITRSSRDDE